MAGCPFCRKEDDTHDRKIYNTCDIAYGQRCPPCVEYLEVEAEIERTRQTLEEQLARRRAIRKKINRRHDPVLNRVPREITAYIFELSSSVEEKARANTLILREGEMYAPLPLGRVCGAWRDIAWSMPQLWNFMYANLPGTWNADKLAPFLDVAKQWLERTGDYLPLSMHLCINKVEGCDDRDADYEAFTPFFQLFNGYSSRWRDLSVYGPTFLFEDLSAASEGAPNLRNLQLISNYPEYWQDRDVPLIFDLGCKTLPQPRRLRIDNVIDQQVVIDWSQITQLETDSPLVIELLRLLPDLHELTDLRINKVNDEVDIPYEPFRHPKIRSFSFTCQARGDDLAADFLDVLVFPSLQHFTVDLQHSVDYVETVTAFLQRSACSLLSLSISHIPQFEDTDRFIPFLQCLDLLEELEISDGDRPNGCYRDNLNFALFELVVLQSCDSQDYIPKLQRLKYSTPDPDPNGTLWSTLFHLANKSSSSGDFQVYIETHERTSRVELSFPRQISILRENLLGFLDIRDSQLLLDSDSGASSGSDA